LKKSEPKEIEFHPDAMQRFERAVLPCSLLGAEHGRRLRVFDLDPACSNMTILREFDCRDRPLSIVALDRNSEAVEFVKPNVFDRAGYSIGEDDGLADKFRLGLLECGHDR
jgi:hypothetical protein